MEVSDIANENFLQAPGCWVALGAALPRPLRHPQGSGSGGQEAEYQLPFALGLGCWCGYHRRRRRRPRRLGLLMAGCAGGVIRFGLGVLLGLTLGDVGRRLAPTSHRGGRSGGRSTDCRLIGAWAAAAAAAAVAAAAIADVVTTTPTGFFGTA